VAEVREVTREEPSAYSEPEVSLRNSYSRGRASAPLPDTDPTTGTDSESEVSLSNEGIVVVVEGTSVLWDSDQFAVYSEVLSHTWKSFLLRVAVPSVG